MTDAARRIPAMLACVLLVGVSCEAAREERARPTASSSATQTPPAPDVARRLGAAPRSCPGPRPRREEVSRTYAPLVGARPLWAGFYAGYEPRRGVFVARDAPRTERGFRVKVLWVMGPAYEGRVSLSGENRATGAPVGFHFEHTGDTTEPVLTPDVAGIGEQGWKEFPSYAYFDGAGCFTIEASSEHGSWRIGFGFGSR